MCYLEQQSNLTRFRLGHDHWRRFPASVQRSILRRRGIRFFEIDNPPKVKDATIQMDFG